MTHHFQAVEPKKSYWNDLTKLCATVDKLSLNFETESEIIQIVNMSLANLAIACHGNVLGGKRVATHSNIFLKSWCGLSYADTVTFYLSSDHLGLSM